MIRPTRTEIAGLTTRIVEPANATLTCVLMHGFGAPGDDLVSLAEAFTDLPVRFVFPAAPLELGGLYGDARAWWMLDLAAIEADQRRGIPRDRRNEIPNGLVEARTQMLALLDTLTGPLVIGGFSQGAMMALDLALHRATPPAGLALMSGTLLAESIWQPRMPSLAGVPIMISHGQHDGLLPFAMAELLRDKLAEAGAKVSWQPFAGGHEIPMKVVDAVGALLRERARSM